MICRVTVLMLALTALSPKLALLHAQEARVTAIRGGFVIPVSGPPIENGTVLIRDGLIAAVGRDVRVPAGAVEVDASGRYVMPGLVDARSYYGIAAEDLNEGSRAIAPELRVIEAYYPFGQFGSGPFVQPRAEDLLRGGVTAHYIAPGDRAVVAGQGAVVKSAGPSFDALVLREPAAVGMTIGGRPANHFRSTNASPGSRLAVMAQLRSALIQASEYATRQRKYEELPSTQMRAQPPPTRDLGMEALVRVLRREIPARIQANRTVEIRNALQLADEFEIDIVIESGIAAHELAVELATRGIPVVLGPTSHPYVSGEEIPDKSEYPDPDERRAAWLAEAGVPFAIASFSRAFGQLGPAGTGQWLLLEAGLAVGYGLPEIEALRAVTLRPAQILGVADRVGSLEVGKDADVIILDGPPLSVRSRVERVYVGGEEVFVREPPAGR